MKLLDILQEKRSIPAKYKGDIRTLKEYIFRDWQTFNQKVVPSFKLLRGRVVKESYNSTSAKNSLMSLVDFAAKKYTAECTNRKYMWNEIFPRKERYALATQLVEFFEKYNLTPENSLILEQGSQEHEAKVSFSEIEVGVSDDKPKLVLNFNYDEETTNYITNILSKGQTLQLRESDLMIMKNLLKVNLMDVSSGQQMSYLRFEIEESSITRPDIKQLTSGAFLNRPVVLEIIGDASEQFSDTEPELDSTNQVQSPEISDTELREIVKESILKYKGRI